MNKKVVLSILFLMSFALYGFANDVKSMFLATPDSILPLIGKIEKEVLMNITEKSDTISSQKNMIGDVTTWISHFDDNLIVYHTSNIRTLEYRMLPCENDDSLLCLITTIAGPEKESKVQLYDKRWNLISTIDLSELVQKLSLDSVSNQQMGSYIPEVEIPLISASFDKNDEKSLIISRSLVLLNDEEKNKQNHAFLQTKVKWDGKIFK